MEVKTDPLNQTGAANAAPVSFFFFFIMRGRRRRRRVFYYRNRDAGAGRQAIFPVVFYLYFVL